MTVESPRHTGGPAARPVQLHAEVYVSAKTGERIQISCTCPIGTDHDYAQWVAANEASRVARRARTSRVG